MALRDWSEGKLLLVTSICCVLPILGAGVFLTMKIMEWKDLKTVVAKQVQSVTALERRIDQKEEFDAAGETIGYISLNQARVPALEHAREGLLTSPARR